MEIGQIRDELHQYIDNADDRLINLMYGMIQADMMESDHQLTKEHKKILDSRLVEHQKAPDSGSDWDESKHRIESQL